MDYSDHGGGLGHDAGRSVAGARRRPAGWPFRRGPADEPIGAGPDTAQPVELAAVLEHVTDAIGVLDAEGGFRYLNKAAVALLGQPTGSGLDRLESIVHPDDWPGLVEHFGECRRTPNSVVPLQLRVRRPGSGATDTWISLDGTLTNRLDDHAVGGIVVLLSDVTSQRAYESLLVHQALHDPLTELPNRLVLIDRIAQALRRAQRHSTRPVVMFFDLDRFKMLNDTLGHAYGDRLLVAVAERVRELLRDSDTLARFGGDEFAVLCEDISSDGEAALIARRILNAFERPFHVDSQDVFLSTSVGVAMAERASTDPHQLLADADAAMYQAKELGRGRCELFDASLRHRLRRRLDVENALHEALPRHELEVHYQPVFTADGQSLVGVEALVRWRQGDQLIPPAEFIPVAEEAGLIDRIDEFVLESACRQLSDWDLAGIPGLTLSVNLSPRHLTSPTLVNEVAAVIRRTGVDPSRLVLEVTESSFMSDLSGAQKALGGLRELGISVGVDDFGTGFSSLSYLRDLPVDVLKIDRSFVTPLGEQDAERGVIRDRAVVRAIVDLAHSLGLRTVGEGVETAEQLAVLEGLGCDYAQGFHLHRPVPPEEIIRAIAAEKARPEVSGAPHP